MTATQGLTAAHLIMEMTYFFSRSWNTSPSSSELNFSSSHNSDLYIEIGYVSLSWITHRYVFRVYDSRSGTIIAAGETTSWGSLAENLSKNIVRELKKIAEKG